MDIKQLSYRKKKLISYVRDGDFSHPGEISAIEQVFQYIEKKPNALLLDVGCGLGGTARYIKDKGYGTPIGIDIDQNNIDYAMQKNPDIELHCCDVLDSYQLFKNIKFDLIYLFSSFLTFEKQQESLLTLSKLGKPDSTLLLFDYTSSKLPNLPNLTWTAKLHTPINPEKIVDQLYMSGWKLIKFVDLSNNFLQWYLEVIDMIKQKKREIINQFSVSEFNSLFATYDFYAECYKNNILGGCIIKAKKI